MWFETLLKSVQAECTTNVSRKCVPGARTSNQECTIAHPRPRPRDVEGEAVGIVTYSSPVCNVVGSASHRNASHSCLCPVCHQCVHDDLWSNIPAPSHSVSSVSRYTACLIQKSSAKSFHNERLIRSNAQICTPHRGCSIQKRQ